MRVAESPESLSRTFLQCWGTAARMSSVSGASRFHSDSIFTRSVLAVARNLFPYSAGPFQVPSVAHTTSIQRRRDTCLLQRTGSSYPSLASLVTLQVPD